MPFVFMASLSLIYLCTSSSKVDKDFELQNWSSRVEVAQKGHSTLLSLKDEIDQSPVPAEWKATVMDNFISCNVAAYAAFAGEVAARAVKSFTDATSAMHAVLSTAPCSTVIPDIEAEDSPLL